MTTTFHRPWAEVVAFRKDLEKGDTHSWVDESRHGSPWYKCEYCAADKGDVYGYGPDPLETALKVMPNCSKAAEALEAEEQRRIKAEKEEYAQLVRRKERERYLEETYA